jgi:hypothetical protein
MTHLAPEEIVDAADGGLADARMRHLEDCETCRRHVEELSVLLRDAADDVVPEPPPFFWEQLSARVRAAIDAEPAPARWWRRWQGWRLLAPAGAAAIVALAVGTSLLREPPAASDVGSSPPPPSMAVAPTAGPAPSEPDDRLARDDWEMVADLVAPLDWDTAVAAGFGLQPGDAEAAVATLTSEERSELHRLLAAELQRPKS